MRFLGSFQILNTYIFRKLNMEKNISKIFLSALIMSGTINTACRADETVVTYPTVALDETFTPDNIATATTESAPREIEPGKAMARGLSRLLALSRLLGYRLAPSLCPGRTHRMLGGHDELLHSEELIEWFFAGGALPKCFLTYPLMTASTLERIIVTFTPALIAAGIAPEYVPLALGLFLPNLFAALKMDQRRREDPTITGADLKESEALWHLGLFLPGALIGAAGMRLVGDMMRKKAREARDEERRSRDN